MIAFSKTVPFRQIKQHIDEKKNENTKLEDHKRNLENQIQKLQKEEASSKTRRDAALYNEKTTDEEIESFIDLKTELKSLIMCICSS